MVEKDAFEMEDEEYEAELEEESLRSSESDGMILYSLSTQIYRVLYSRNRQYILPRSRFTSIR
jgi:hypothetical protein